MSQESPENQPGFAPPSEPLPEPEQRPGPFHRPYGQSYGGPGPASHGGQQYLPQTGGPAGRPYGPGPVPMDPTLAEWWQRLLARIVDGIITGLIVSPLWIWFFIWYLRQLPTFLPASGETPPDMNEILRIELKLMAFSLLVGLAQAVVSFGYDWFQHAKWGQTIGKRIMKIKVVALPDRAPTGGKAAAKRAAAYALAPQVPAVGGAFGLINVLWLLWDKPNRQCLHDKFADTVVVKIDPGPGR